MTRSELEAVRAVAVRASKHLEQSLRDVDETLRLLDVMLDADTDATTDAAVVRIDSLKQPVP